MGRSSVRIMKIESCILARLENLRDTLNDEQEPGEKFTIEDVIEMAVESLEEKVLL